MRDTERKNAKDYRKEEWVAYDVPPRTVDAAARRGTRGRFFVCAVRGMDEDDLRLKKAYKGLGYRLLATEALFVHRLRRIPRVGLRGGRGAAAVVDAEVAHSHPLKIERVATAVQAARFGQATRTRPIAGANLGDDAPFRQFVAIENGQLIGWVRSVNAGDAAWCSNMYVAPAQRRRGIGRALLTRMLQDDHRRGFQKSVLLASHAGALLYPHVGYEQIGQLLIFVPSKKSSS